MKKIYQILKKNKLELGIVISIFAVSISSMLKEIFGINSSNITIGIFILALILMLNLKNIVLKFSLLNKEMIIIILFQIYNIILSLLNNKISFFTNGFGMAYLLYIIFFAIILSTNRREINSKSFIKIVWITTALLNIFSFYLIKRNVMNQININFGALDNGAERSTMSGIPFGFITCCFCYWPKEKLKRLFSVVVLILSFYNLLACNRRSIYISIILCLIIFIIKKIINCKSNIVFRNSKILKILFLIIMLSFVVYFIKDTIIFKYINDANESLKSGISTLIGNSIDDPSTSVRFRNRKMAIEYLKNANILQTIFGRGYNFFWIDFPFLQAFIDMGFIGGLVYFYLQFVIVIKDIFYISELEEVKYCQYMMISIFINNFSSGVPYGVSKFCPLIILIYIVWQAKKYKI